MNISKNDFVYLYICNIQKFFLSQKMENDVIQKHVVA